jgi:amidophosphoribosyltransferase
MCGIAGACGVDDASYVISLMLKAMQHRGQEAAGIVSYDGSSFHELRGKGLVDEVFADVDYAKALPGRTAIGHIRYSTAGDPDSRESIQPLVAQLRQGPTAIVHNGNLTNYAERRSELEEAGAIFRSKSDTELFLHLIARARGNRRERLSAAFDQVEGAYSLLLMTPRGITAAVDPLGFRPLSMLRFGAGWLFASETCAFDLFRDDPRFAGAVSAPVDRGRVISIDDYCATAFTREAAAPSRHCSFEHIYFSRPDSTVFGRSANAVRERLGRALAAAGPADADLVTAVPDSSNAMAAAYADALGLPFRFALIRNHYTGRTFITPRQTARELGVRMKLGAVRDAVAGKRIVVVDDSLVRGTTARKVVALLRDAGATEVHLRIGSPPVIHPCHWGIDTPSRRELAAADGGIENLRLSIGADSLGYLPLESLREALDDADGSAYCVTCFSGESPLVPLGRRPA